MSDLTIMEVKEIKTLISQAKALEKTVENILYSDGQESTKYASFKNMAFVYNDLADRAKKVMKFGVFYIMNTDDMGSWGNTVWPITKSILESVLVSTRMLITTLESNIDFIGEEIDNVENFIKIKLRGVIFDVPTKEKEVQNGIETLFVGKGYGKGIDYDRETGKFNYSGREYIPDFILPKLRMCIEVKLLKEASKKSKVIEEINADITAYSKEYENLLSLIANRNATLLICNCVLVVTKFIETKRLRLALQKIGDEPVFLFTLHWISRYPEWVGGRMGSNHVKIFP